ncbi:MAG: Inosine-5'-monophosphate dehydrogenase [Chloroflexi bacterium ADurb.Bin325]|nr:MAG: Inosine-5'-monophosphate dehydrogenase [Chloroflexi bacterium ADurb.Bin325]
MDKKQVGEIMTSPAIVVGPDMSVSAANALMREKSIRHLPVVDKGRLVGIVSRGDLREATFTEAVNADTYELHFMLNRLTVERLMTRRVYTITADAPLVQAVELLNKHKIASLPVVDAEGQVIGIITESDLLKTLAHYLRQLEATAEAA